MRIDVEHPFPGAQVLLNNTPVAFVHVADDIAGYVEAWEPIGDTQQVQLVRRKGWVTIVPPQRPASMPHPWIATAPWNQQN